MIISDASVRGIKTAKRIIDLAKELNLEIDKYALIINKVSGEEEDNLKELAQSLEIKTVGVVPLDKMISEYDIQEKPIIQLPEKSSSVQAVFKILDELQIP